MIKVWGLHNNQIGVPGFWCEGVDELTLVLSHIRFKLATRDSRARKLLIGSIWRKIAFRQHDHERLAHVVLPRDKWRPIDQAIFIQAGANAMIYLTGTNRCESAHGMAESADGVQIQATGENRIRARPAIQDSHLIDDKGDIGCPDFSP